MKKQIDYYSILVASKYFETIDDFINLELSSPRFEGNMEKLHFNPISLTSTTRPFFTSLETLHLYQPEDELFEGDPMIFKRINWFREVDYQTYEDEAKGDMIYKNVVYFNNDINKSNGQIPENITRLSRGTQLVRSQKVIIPESVNKIDFSQFTLSSSLKSMILPSNYQCYDNNVFIMKPHLEKFIIPTTVRYINKKLYEKEPFISFDIPTYVTSLGDNCFKGCMSLSSIHIPDSVQSIGEECFEVCRSLKEITLPSSLTFISRSCFCFCLSLTKITFPSEWKCFGNQVFITTSTQLCSFTLSENIKIINGSLKSEVFNKNETTFVIPSNIKALSEKCFMMNNSLRSIVIPPTIETIGDYCFYMCQKLKKVIVKSPLRQLSRLCFGYCNKLQTVELPPTIVELNQQCFENCFKLKMVILPNVETICDNCFHNCHEMSL